jgi:hypothetical protein
MFMQIFTQSTFCGVLCLSKVGWSVLAHPAQTVLGVVDISPCMFCRGFPGSSLQNVTVGFVHEAVNTRATNDFDIALAIRESEAVTHRETVVVAMGVVDLLASGEKALEGVIKVRCHD